VLNTVSDFGNTSVSNNGEVIITLDHGRGGTVFSTSLGTGSTDTSGHVVTRPVTGGTDGSGSTFPTVSGTSGTLGGSGDGDI